MLVRLIVRRLFFLVFVLFGFSLITFGLSHIVPGDPARLMAGPRASKSAVEKIERNTASTIPCPINTLTTSKSDVEAISAHPLHAGGRSWTTCGRYLPATIELGSIAFMMSTLIGVPLGVISSVRRDQCLTTWPGSFRSPGLLCLYFGWPSWPSSSFSAAWLASGWSRIADRYGTTASRHRAVHH